MGLTGDILGVSQLQEHDPESRQLAMGESLGLQKMGPQESLGRVAVRTSATNTCQVVPLLGHSREDST